MTKITDMTITCLEKYNPTQKQLRLIVDLLISVGVDFIELTADTYKKIGELNPKGKYVLRVDFPNEADKFIGFERYICHFNGGIIKNNIITEIQVNDIREINLLSQYENLKNVRIVGLDDIIKHNYITVFSNLKRKLSGNIELCPENKYCCATAIALEWILQGEKDIVTSFAGIGSKTPFEEVMMALRIEKRHKPNVDFSVFPKLKELIENIMQIRIPRNKSIIGSDIFNIESGIHANGISKNPKLYEPFPPELVGNNRKLILGKHSGKTAIILKMSENGLSIPNANIDEIVGLVRKKSIEIGTSITDEMFLKIYYSF